MSFFKRDFERIFTTAHTSSRLGWLNNTTPRRMFNYTFESNMFAFDLFPLHCIRQYYPTRMELKDALTAFCNVLRAIPRLQVDGPRKNTYYLIFLPLLLFFFLYVFLRCTRVGNKYMYLRKRTLSDCEFIRTRIGRQRLEQPIKIT